LGSDDYADHRLGFRPHKQFKTFKQFKFKGQQ
jgi:hypothetical protein